jgi:hypothetical protein
VAEERKVDYFIDVQDLERRPLFQALFNGARPQGFFKNYHMGPITEELTDEFLGRTFYDMIQGRHMQIRIDPKPSKINCRLYDRNNGENAAALIVAILRSTKDPAHALIQMICARGSKYVEAFLTQAGAASKLPEEAKPFGEVDKKKVMSIREVYRRAQEKKDAKGSD